MAQRSKILRLAALTTIGALAVAILVVVLPMLRATMEQKLTPTVVKGEKKKPGALFIRDEDTLQLETGAINSLGVTVATVRPAPPTSPLVLSGSLFIDSNRMVFVHTRFPGEVVSIGSVAVEESPDEPLLTNDRIVDHRRPLQFGDAVTQGQLLAVVWCKDIGEKKSDLVDALSRLFVDQANLDRLKRLDKGVVPEQTVRDAQRAYEADLIEVERLERTLRSWRESEDEIAEVRAEAERIRKGDQEANKHLEKSWAEVDVRAPFDGIIMEKNVVVGDIVATDLSLFKIADLHRLGVMANVYEEDLPKLTALAHKNRNWQIRLKSDPNVPPIAGKFDVVGKIIDPQQHSGTVMGWVDNRDERLCVGQFISATVPLPVPDEEVAIPNSAVIEDGPTSVIFVAKDEGARQVTMRRVSLVRRVGEMTVVRANPNQHEREAGAQPLHVGEHVVSHGNLELLGVIQELDEGLAKQ